MKKKVLRAVLLNLFLGALPLETALAAGHGADEPQFSGFGLAILLLGIMTALVLYVIGRFVSGLPEDTPQPPAWQDKAIPWLAVLGLAVAIYLTYIETTPDATAICGPVGNCNAVQKSPYAMLFGVLPVAVLGALGYLFILLTWGLAHWKARPEWARWGYPALFAAAFFGELFTIYLTYLEPFVIRAVCIWCLTSAVIMTLIFWFAWKPAMLALEEGEA
jgi:uncharacterized membrane protein